MQKVSDLFEAEAFNPCQVANLENGNVGFRIPEYQRPYDWSQSNIKRLMTDIFSGFERLSHTTKASSFTFLGTLILVKDQKQEPKFRGKSYSVVDGQQRLTTLTLVACALIERLRILKDDFPSLSPEIDRWLEIESEHIEANLADCVTGAQKIKGKEFFAFPRIVRSEDMRGDSAREEMLRSGISKFLTEFGKYVESDEIEFSVPNLGDTREADKLAENFSLIRGYCKSLNDPEWYAENDCQFLEATKFRHGGCKQLWEKVQDVLESDGLSAISSIEKEPAAHAFYRTLMLAAYFCNCIAVTTVVTQDETAAFDIFDALNTTGEPLTALETLKPQVIVAENSSKNHKYAGSECEMAFQEIDEIMATDYPETNQKQNEAKDLVITFALYLEGRKVSRELSAQRSELRQSFQRSLRSDDEGASKFMTALAGVTKYRSVYWVADNQGEINAFHPAPSVADEVKLLSGFISAMKTSLALPILSRYWIHCRESGNFNQYVEILKAVSAFLALRRAATGGTDGIDTCFRDIMEPGASAKKFGLCAGAGHENAIPEVSELKAALLQKLCSSKVKFSNRDEWVDHVVDVPIYAQARPLARFLLFSATHNTALDATTPGLLTRESVVPSDDRAYLTYGQWMSEHYVTVEHVAPNSDKPVGWDKSIYANARIRNTLGNLVLLPSEENSSIGAATWSKKKTFYSALTANTTELRRQELDKAKRNGMRFNKKTEGLILDGTRFSMLDGVKDVNKWDAEFINARSRRLAELAWSQLRPWLD